MSTCRRAKYLWTCDLFMHFDKKMTYINLGGLGRVLLLSVEMSHIQKKIFKINPQKNKIRNLRHYFACLYYSSCKITNCKVDIGIGIQINSKWRMEWRHKRSAQRLCIEMIKIIRLILFCLILDACEYHISSNFKYLHCPVLACYILNLYLPY